MDNVFHAYLAGFLDADGHISVLSCNKGTSVTVAVGFTNRDEATLDEIMNEFGGKKALKAGSRKNKTWAPTYTLMFFPGTAGPLLRALLPYLRQKKRRAELALEVMGMKQDRSKQYRLTDAERERRFEILTEARRLNGMGQSYPNPNYRSAVEVV